MVTFHQSTSLQHLAEEFSRLQSNDSRPLEPHWVIVQNNEIKEWLQLQVAKSEGIAGNFKFIFPSEFLWTLYRLGNDNIPQYLPSDLTGMQWALFELFSTEKELLQQIPYYNVETDSPKKRFQLCTQLADNFDQYQVYRPEMMTAWLQKRLVSSHKDEKWQSIIWNRLNEKWQQNSAAQGIPSRSEAFDQLLDWMKHDEAFLRKLPSRLWVFGLSHISEPFMQLMATLGKEIEVHLFSKHVEEEELSLPESVKTLLKDWSLSYTEQFQLWKNILAETKTPTQWNEVEPNKSLSFPGLKVHSCHNIRREVQVLKDQLLHYFEQHPQSGPENVLLMVPDAEKYASQIESVFEHNENEPSIPVANISGNYRQSAAFTLIKLLKLFTTSYKTSEIVEILHLQPIKQKFEFTDDDLDALEEWVVENKVFRGLGSSFNAIFSLQKAVNQMLLGFSMEPEELQVYNGLVPFSDVSSTDDMQLVSKFRAFIQALIKAEQVAQKKHAVSDWIDFAGEIVADFMANSNQEKAVLGINKTLNKLGEQVGYAEAEVEIGYQTIKNWLIAQFDNTSSDSGRFGQGITLSSYIPYRSVPFDFIGVLGLNEGVFPRKAVRPDFDLIYANPQPGDRIQKEDDTFLFYETMLAVSERLHFSYLGQDQKSNSKRLPSILVQQYLDKMNGNWEKEAITHKLYPFNAQYFKGAKKLYSFSKENLKLAQIMQQEIDEADPFLQEEKRLADLEKKQKEAPLSNLISFFSYPAKYMLRNKLDVSNYSDFTIITDREPFTLNNLERYNLENFIFEKITDGSSDSKVYTYAKYADLLPAEMVGEKKYHSEKQEVDELITTVKEYQKGEERNIDIELETLYGTVIGNVSGVYQNKLISYRVGSRRASHEAAHWLKHLLLTACGSDVSESVFISKEKEGVEILRLNAPENPKELISDFLRWFNEESALVKSAFFPETSRKYAKVFEKEKDLEKALEKAYRKWEYHEKYNQYAESNDYFNALLWRDRDPLALQAFQDNAAAFWLPFLATVEDEE